MKRLFPCATGAMVAIMCLWLCACHKDLNLDNWAPNVLGPLINGYATVEEVSDLTHHTFTQSVAAYNINQLTNVSINVPPLDIANVGPFPYQLSDFFAFANVDSMDFIISFKNVFPITISAGTYVVFRSQENTTDPNDIIVKYKLPNDIPAYSSYSFETLIRNTTVPNVMYMYLDSFLSPGGQNVVFTDSATQITFQIKVLSIFKAALFTNKNYTLYDTSSIQFGQQVANYNDSAATGLVKIFLTNSMPINFVYQMYFLDDNNVLIDSLYLNGDMPVTGGTTDANGVPQDSIQKEYDITLSAARIGRLKTSTKLAYKLYGDTNGYPGSLVYIGPECEMHILMTGNLKILITKFVTL